MDVAGKVVVVTGGGNGIGKGLCERFHREGAATVVVADLELDSAQAVADAIGGEAFGVDVRDESQIAAMVADVEARHGRIDLFCSNAGIIALDGEQGWATSAPNSVWEAMWDIHVMSHVWAARACLPMCRAKMSWLNVSALVKSLFLASCLMVALQWLLTCPCSMRSKASVDRSRHPRVKRSKLKNAQHSAPSHPVVFTDAACRAFARVVRPFPSKLTKGA